jgi:hypothetical protein
MNPCWRPVELAPWDCQLIEQGVGIGTHDAMLRLVLGFVVCPRTEIRSSVGMQLTWTSDVSGLMMFPSPEFCRATTLRRPASAAPTANDNALPSLAAGT